MKFKKTLSAFGLIAVAGSTLATGPAAFAEVSVDVAPTATTAATAFQGAYGYPDTGPTLAGGKTGDVIATIESTGDLKASEKGIAFTFTAPSGTTLNSSSVAWAQRYGGKGTWTKGSKVCLVALDAKSISCDWSDLEVPGSSGGTQRGSIGATFSLKADAKLYVGGLVNDGRFLVTGGAAVEAGLVTAIGFHAVQNATGPSVTSPKVGSVIRESQPVFAGTGSAGAAIEVEDAAGRSLADTVVKGDGTWSVKSDVDFAEGKHAGAVRMITSNNVVTTTPWSFEYALVKDVAVTSPAAGSAVDIPRPIVSGVGEAGASIELLFAGKNERSYKTTVAVNGTWSVTPTISLKKGLVEGQVTQTFEGAQRQAAFSFTYGVVAPIADVKLTAPAVGAKLKDARPVFSGTGENGATIEVVEGGKTIAATTVAAGKWSATPAADMSAGEHVGVVNQKVQGAQQSSVPFSFTREAASVDALMVTDPVQGGVLNVGASGWVVPVFTGTATPGATVRVQGPWGDVFATTIADAKGAWSARWMFGVLPNHYVGGSTVQVVNEVEVDRVGYDFTVVARASLSVESPTVGGTVTAGATGWVAPTFTGTATPGADVRVENQYGLALGSTVADRNGNWVIRWAFSVQPNWYYGSTIESIDGADVNSVLFEFSVVKGG